jgi:hypothetical protein
MFAPLILLFWILKQSDLRLVATSTIYGCALKVFDLMFLC